MHYLEATESIQYQAELFWNASLLIWPHGATMAHTLFLPRAAQAIELIHWVQEDKAKLPGAHGGGGASRRGSSCSR
jgi:capsular polysaccharide biosynthesis protein